MRPLTCTPLPIFSIGPRLERKPISRECGVQRLPSPTPISGYVMIFKQMTICNDLDKLHRLTIFRSTGRSTVLSSRWSHHKWLEDISHTGLGSISHRVVTPIRILECSKIPKMVRMRLQACDLDHVNRHQAPGTS